MEKYAGKLNSIDLPEFILIKNLEFEHPEDLDAPISRGEILANATDFETLKVNIPAPKIPEEDYKLSLYEEKYGDPAIIKPEFDDSPMDISVGDPCDYEIFGMSYTIVWFVEPNEDRIVELLIEAYLSSRNLIFIYDNFIDRMHIYPFYSLEIISDDFYDNVCNKFENAAKGLKNPPSQQEWDDLYEYL